MDELKAKTKALKVYRIVNEIYGCRVMWIADLAELLCISVSDAGTLTAACGYCRGKHITDISLREFASNTDVIEVLKKIPDEVAEDRRHYLP